MGEDDGTLCLMKFLSFLVILNLQSSNGKIVQAPRSAVILSKFFKDMLEEIKGEQIELPAPDVEEEVLKKIVEFCKHYTKEKMVEIEKPLKSANLREVVDEWYAKYIEVDMPLLFKLIMGANYLEIQPLLDLGCAKVASQIKNKSPEEIRETFGIKNDFTPEEEKQIREENKWCDEM